MATPFLFRRALKLSDVEICDSAPAGRKIIEKRLCLFCELAFEIFKFAILFQVVFTIIRIVLLRGMFHCGQGGIRLASVVNVVSVVIIRVRFLLLSLALLFNATTQMRATFSFSS
jgi:hypothetical protein